MDARFYEIEDYKRLIQYLFDSRGKFANWTYSKAARFCGVQPTYFSNVLKDRADFNEDQVFLLCEYFALSEPESEYFQLCHSRQRSQYESRKLILQNQMREVAQKAQLRANRLGADLVSPTSEINEVLFFADPRHQLLLLSLGIEPKLERLPEIAKSLGLSDDNLDALLKVLIASGRIRLNGDSFIKEKVNQHLGADSVYLDLHQERLHQLCAERIRRLPRDQYRSLSATFSGSLKDKDTIYETVTRSMEKIRQLIKKSKNKHDAVFQVNLGAFTWFENPTSKDRGYSSVSMRKKSSQER